MKKNNKGFTLIELLAIIVILAIIAVITVPIILNIIEKSRKGAATDSAYGYKDSVNKFYIAELQNHNKLKLDGTYTVMSDGSLEPTEDNTFGFGDSEYGDSLDVAISGTIPSSGSLTYENNILTTGCLIFGDYVVTFNNYGVTDTKKGDCPKKIYYTYVNNNTIQTETFENWNFYVVDDQLNNTKEICGKFKDGSVMCFDPKKWDGVDGEYANMIKQSTEKEGSIVCDWSDLGTTSGHYAGLQCYDIPYSYSDSLNFQYDDEPNYGARFYKGYNECKLKINGDISCYSNY